MPPGSVGGPGLERSGAGRSHRHTSPTGRSRAREGTSEQGRIASVVPAPPDDRHADTLPSWGMSETKTVRDRIRAALEQGPHTALQISGAVGIPQGEVAEHLRHLERSLEHEAQTLVVLPARCVPCGFVFEGRKRHARPSRCPQCRRERIEPPRFSIV